MLIQRDNPQGIDIAIQKLQSYLHDALMTAWGLDQSDATQNALYKSYDRCYRNRTSDRGYRAELFTGGSDYQEAYFDDTLNAISFFGIGSTENFDIGEKAQVHLIFFANLVKLKPAIVHRADEEVRKDVQLICEQELFGFKFDSTVLWIENVLREYQASYKSDRLIAIDMQPVHCFRMNFELLYNKADC